MFGQIIASNFKLEPNDPKDFNIPWQERVLSVKLFIDNSEIYFHTTHIPPGSGNGWIKIETLEGIYERLKENKDNLNILCGDFNTPKEEDFKNGMVSFAQRINDKGEAKVRKSFRGGEGVRWDKGERGIIVGLKEFGIEDSFRKLFSYDVKEYSWKFNRKDNVIKRRFDHFFASKKFKCSEKEVYVSSTGVIGSKLDYTKINKVLKNINYNEKSSILEAAKTIMTTDTFAKVQKRCPKVGPHLRVI